MSKRFSKQLRIDNEEKGPVKVRKVLGPWFGEREVFFHQLAEQELVGLITWMELNMKDASQLMMQQFNNVKSSLFINVF